MSEFPYVKIEKQLNSTLTHIDALSQAGISYILHRKVAIKTLRYIFQKIEFNMSDHLTHIFFSFKS